jgi:magnesium-transporting ATPase (P-type)
LAVALEARSEEESPFRIGLFKNRSMVFALVLTVLLQLLVVYLPPAQRIFDTASMPLADLMISIGLSLTILIVIEASKTGLKTGTDDANWLIAINIPCFEPPKYPLKPKNRPVF